MTRQIKNHTASIRQCVLMLENIEIQISYSNNNIKELFNVLSKKNSFEQLKFITEISKQITDSIDFGCVSNNVFNDKKIMNCFDSEDIELLKGFFSVFGQTDVNGQILNCRTYKEFFKQKLALLESEEKTKCKSQTAITIGLGLIFTIVII